MKVSKFIGMQNQRIKDLMDKKPMTSSITITALQDQHQQANHPTFHSPLDQHKYFKKKSMMSPRFSEHPHNNPNKPQAQVKMSSIYQYERQYNNFPLSNEYVISEDNMDDSPAKKFYNQAQPRERQDDFYHR